VPPTGVLAAAVHVMPDVTLTSLGTRTGTFAACALVQSAAEPLEGRIGIAGGAPGGGLPLWMLYVTP